jgi:hypothetical protein
MFACEDVPGRIEYFSESIERLGALESFQLAWNEEHQRENDIKGNRKPGIEECEQNCNRMKNGIQYTFHHG